MEQKPDSPHLPLYGLNEKQFGLRVIFREYYNTFRLISLPAEKIAWDALVRGVDRVSTINETRMLAEMEDGNGWQDP